MTDTPPVDAQPVEPLTARLERLLEEACRGGYVPELPLDLIAARLVAAGVTLDAARAGDGLLREALDSALSELDNIRWDDIWPHLYGGSPSSQELARMSMKYVGYVRADIERALAALPPAAPETWTDEDIERWMREAAAPLHGRPISLDLQARYIGSRIRGKA